MSQTFDIYSYIASLTGNASIIQNKINSLNTEISSLSSQPTTIEQKTYLSPSAQANVSGTDNYSRDNGGYYFYQTVTSPAVSTISSDQAQLPSLQSQLDQFNAQIKAAQQTASTIPRTTPDVSSPSTGLKLPNLSNVSPVLLIAGVGLLILILK